MAVRELPQVNRSPEYRQAALAHLNVEMNQCRLLHRAMECTLDWDAWMNDHPRNGRDMAQVYAETTESEAEAEARLSSDDDDLETDMNPNSSFGN